MRCAVVIAALAVALGCAACTTNSSHPEAMTAAPGHVPAEAVTVVENLASRDPATVRDSLALSYSTQVNTAVLAPAGTQIRVQSGTWQQHGDEARLRAVVTVPGQTPVTEVVYLVREVGRWRVLFTDVP
jgi:hypothetical protein